jgi:hypothetical protein
VIYHVEWQSLCGSGEKMGSYGTLRLKEVRKISRGGNQVPVVAVVVCHVTLLSGRNRSIVGDFHGWRRLPTAVHLGPWQEGEAPGRQGAGHGQSGARNTPVPLLFGRGEKSVGYPALLPVRWGAPAYRVGAVTRPRQLSTRHTRLSASWLGRQPGRKTQGTQHIRCCEEKSRASMRQKWTKVSEIGHIDTVIWPKIRFISLRS